MSWDQVKFRDLEFKLELRGSDSGVVVELANSALGEREAIDQ